MRTNLTLAVSALLLAFLWCAAGCTFVVSKDQNQYFEEGSMPALSTVGESGEANGPGDAEGNQAASAGLVSQNGEWTSTTDAQTTVEQAMRAAVEAVVTGQGSAEGGEADASGNDTSDGGE